MYLCVITAPNPEARQEAARHLRYWPYVKFYKYQGKSSLLACFNLGETKNHHQRKHLYERSRQLVLLCLRQYGVTISRWRSYPSHLTPYPSFRATTRNLLITDETFLRPSSTLRPFIDFIRELDTPSILES